MQKHYFFAVFFTIAFVFPLSAYSAADSALLDPSVGFPKETVVLTYAVLLFLAGLTGYFLWKKGSLRVAGTKEARLKIIENRIIGPKQSLLVIDYEGEKMLLGVSPGIIQHLCFLGDAEKLSSSSSQLPFESLLQTDVLQEGKPSAKFRRHRSSSNSS